MTDERKRAILAVKHIMKPLPYGKQRTDLETAVCLLRGDTQTEVEYIEKGIAVSELFKFHTDYDNESEFDHGWNSAILEVIKILKGEDNAETNDI